MLLQNKLSVSCNSLTPTTPPPPTPRLPSPPSQPQVLLNNNAVPSLPCVQFLNWDSSSAVRMRTSEFLCGPVPQPVTVFVVGIASEDGCFVSGLRGRFEIGHMYPDDRLSEQVRKTEGEWGEDEGERRRMRGKMVSNFTLTIISVLNKYRWTCPPS